MRRPTVLIPLLPAVIACLTAGCGDDESTGPSSAISDEGALALANVVLASTVSALESPAPNPSVAAPVAINVQLSRTHACPAGGNIGVSGSLTGSFDSETGSGSAWLQVLATYTDCGVEAAGVNYVANGDPYLTVTGSFTWLGGVPATQQTVRIGGALSLNGRFCAINLTILYATAGSSSSSISGTVCGVPVNEDV